MKDHGEKIRFETNVVTRTMLFATVIVCMSTQSKTLIFQQITRTYSGICIHIHILHTHTCLE